MITNQKKNLSNKQMLELIFAKRIDKKLKNKNFANFLKEALEASDVDEFLKNNVIQTMDYSTLKNIGG